MRFGTIILILVVGLIVVYAFFPNTWAQGKEWVTGKVSVPKTTNNTTKVTTLPDTTVSNVTPTVLPNLTRSVPIILKNACGINNTFGKPDYAGTTKAGEGCESAYQPDLACLANPPKNYDGTIDTINQVATPPITCCMGDGTCQW